MAKAFTLRNGLILLSTEAPGGIYNSAQLKKVSALCDENTAIVKATEDQRLALFVKPENAKKVKTELEAVGLGVRNYQDGLHQPVNCVGNMCPENLQDALGTSMELQKTLSSLQLSSALKIGINGCYKCCVPTHTLDISIIGDTKGYRISLGGKNSQLPEMACFMAENVPSNEIPRLVEQIIKIYQAHMNEDESLQDVMERVGTSEFVKALHPYSQDAAGADDPFGGFSETADTEGSAPLEDELEVAGDITFDEMGSDVALEEIDSSGDLESLDLSDIEDSSLLGGNATEEFAVKDDFAVTDDFSSTEDFATTDDMSDLEIGGNVDIAIEDESDLTSLETDVPIAGNEPLEMSDDIDFGEDGTLGDELSLDSSLEVSDSDIMEDLGELSDLKLDQSFDADPDFEGLESAEMDPEPKISEDLPLDESGNALDADEVAESDADAFEQKLNASIEEEESMPLVEDENSESRLAAVRLVEAAIDDGTSTSDLDSDSLDDGEFGNLEIDRDSPEFGEDIDHIDLSPEVFDENMDDEPAPKQMHSHNKSSSYSAGGSNVCGIDLIENGKISVKFENGARVTISPESISGGRREISVGGKPIGIALSGSGINIEVDGMSVFFPKAAA